MVGRATLTPGRLLALAGALAAVGGLYQRVPEGGTLWRAAGGAGRAGVIAGVALLISAAFRPDRGWAVELSGAGLEHLVGWGALVLAALHPESPVLMAGAAAVAVGASWDLVAAWRARPAGTMQPEGDGWHEQRSPIGAGASEGAH